jgi:hypothetical protein
MIFSIKLPSVALKIIALATYALAISPIYSQRPVKISKVILEACAVWVTIFSLWYRDKVLTFIDQRSLKAE